MVLVEHAEAVPADQKDGRNPLYLGTTLIYPNLGHAHHPLDARLAGVLLHGARRARRPLTGRVELVQDGRARCDARAAGAATG